MIWYAMLLRSLTPEKSIWQTPAVTLCAPGCRATNDRSSATPPAGCQIDKREGLLHLTYLLIKPVLFLRHRILPHWLLFLLSLILTFSSDISSSSRSFSSFSVIVPLPVYPPFSKANFSDRVPTSPVTSTDQWLLSTHHALSHPDISWPFLLHPFVWPSRELTTTQAKPSEKHWPNLLPKALSPPQYSIHHCGMFVPGVELQGKKKESSAG